MRKHENMMYIADFVAEVSELLLDWRKATMHSLDRSSAEMIDLDKLRCGRV